MSARSNSNRNRPIRHARPVAESTAVLDHTAHRGVRVDAHETPTILTEASRPGRLLVQLIRSGWSLNGRYYPAEVLKRDGAKAFPAGTLNHVDHATDQEDEDRPAGSLRNLASYQTEDARWDATRNALVAEVRLFAPWREAVTDWARSGAVGMSIRAWVYGDEGEAEGRQGWVVSEFDSGRSVDYVTVPAAGGALLSVIESMDSSPRTARAATTEARTLGGWLESRFHLAMTQFGDDMYGHGRLTRDERITLSSATGDALKAWTTRVEADAPQLFVRDLYDDPDNPQQQATVEAAAVGEATSEETRRALTAAVRAAHGGDGVYVWLRDYDADEHVCWYDRSTEDTCQTWRETYTVDGGGRVQLGGEAIQVVARVVYDPVTSGGDIVVQAEAVVEQTTTTPTNVTDGPPPTAPTHPTNKEGTSVSGTQNTGPAPGAGGAAEGQAPAPAATTAVSAAEARATLAEAQRDEALTRAAAVTDAQNAAARANAERDSAIAESRRLRADNAGRDAVTLGIAESTLPDGVRALITPRVADRVIGRVPVVAESGDVDAQALTVAVAAAIEAERTYAAALLEAQGVGTVRGLGSTATGAEEITDAAFESELANIFEATGAGADTAKLAAKGR